MLKLVLRFLAAIFFVFSIESCVDLPTDIVLPEWEVDLTIPVMNRYHTLDDILNSYENKNIQPSGINDSIYLIESDNYSIESDIFQFLSIEGPQLAETQIVVPPTGIETSFEIAFPDGAELDSAKFLSGDIFIATNNQSNSNLNIQLTFPGFRNNSGNVLTVDHQHQPQSGLTTNIDLSGFSYKLPVGQSGKDKIKVVVITSQNSSGFSNATIELQTSGFQLSRVAGNLPPKSLGRKRGSFPLNIENVTDLRGNVVLREAVMELTGEYLTSNTNNFAIELADVNIIAKRNEGADLFLQDNSGNSNFNFAFAGSSMQQTFDESNSNIYEFIAHLPDSIIIEADFILNPNHQNGTAQITDSIRFNSFFQTKSFIGLKESSFEDTSNVNLTSEERSALQNSRSAIMYLEFENGMPLSSHLKIDILDSEFNYLFTLSENGNNEMLFFEAAPTDENGEVIQSLKAPVIKMHLDSLEIQQFANAYYSVYKVGVATEEAFQDPNKIIAIRPSAWASYRVYADVTYNVDPEGN